MARRNNKPGFEAVDSFQMLFVTLSLILLAFFILLNSMAVADSDRRRLALGSLLGSFGLLSGGESVESSEEKAARKKSILKEDRAFQMFEKTKRTAAALLGESVASRKEISFSADEKTGDLRIVLSAALLFAPGSAVINPKLFGLLSEISEIAGEAAGSVIVTGHTDNMPTDKTTSNWKLSLERGATIARHIEAVGNLPQGKISAAGEGPNNPIENNQTEAGKAANRRVEILIKTRTDKTL